MAGHATPRRLAAEVGVTLRMPEADALRGLWRKDGIVTTLLIPPDSAAIVAAEFPPPDDPGWHTFHGPLEEGKQEGRAEIAGPNVVALHELLAGDEFVTWLRLLTEEWSLRADPERTGGGIHQSGPGSRLGLHVDFTGMNGREDLVRAVNVILFLDDAPLEYHKGGWFETARADVTEGASGLRIRPKPGLLVVFASDDRLYHGHPVPIAEGEGLRRSIPSYYFRRLRPGETVEHHSTRFLETS